MGLSESRNHTYVPEKTRVPRRVRVLNTRSDTRFIHQIKVYNTRTPTLCTPILGVSNTN